jgi:hypothetical protein
VLDLARRAAAIARPVAVSDPRAKLGLHRLGRIKILLGETVALLPGRFAQPFDVIENYAAESTSGWSSEQARVRS